METKKNIENKNEEPEATEIEFLSYGGEHHLPLIMNLVDRELSEPYSIFTYRYFVYLWPQLSFLVRTILYFDILSLSLAFSKLLLLVLIVNASAHMTHAIRWLYLVGRHSTKENAWGQWYVKWESIEIL